MIVSHQHFMWFISFLTMTTASAWFVVDVVRLRRALPQGRAAHDQIFGSLIGLAVASIGILGVLRYHL